MLALTGKHADGWNAGGSIGAWSEKLDAVRRAAEAAGRSPEDVVASANAVALLGDEPGARRLLAEHPPGGVDVAVGADALRRSADEWRAAGCQHLVLHLSGAIWTSFGLEQLDLAADALGLPS
jgi:alkanesulfonate monooxygenase SsuD/methylene tetrahydromethanopterin reductase-like flavin-dependent oxidoreductase (luciferase family)